MSPCPRHTLLIDPHDPLSPAAALLHPLLRIDICERVFFALRCQFVLRPAESSSCYHSSQWRLLVHVNRRSSPSPDPEFPLKSITFLLSYFGPPPLRLTGGLPNIDVLMCPHPSLSAQRYPPNPLAILYEGCEYYGFDRDVACPSFDSFPIPPNYFLRYVSNTPFDCLSVFSPCPHLVDPQQID
ncbi:hypothetical protein CC1G_10959 [Coprinopsis cinerea okayama7|uniref:Uncharacterized protein n=1 Tax=Coprinopsis cinerea (strain Okayama-7 / 130 / ATCC MYA-4618 / FGSC 9003) TaxID=240176 RepID=A8PBZ5_COPC7|nr:hypothetical protein CC1G_10959 [Coprinopsis cinerea okayama7\|eukprot:XP_001840296.1 hypothetical protein CC1G_10959 [Coprinopsis cinerea okayama7\